MTMNGDGTIDGKCNFSQESHNSFSYRIEYVIKQI